MSLRRLASKAIRWTDSRRRPGPRTFSQTTPDPIPPRPLVLVVHDASVLGGAEASLKTHMQWSESCRYHLAVPDSNAFTVGAAVSGSTSVSMPMTIRGAQRLAAGASLWRAFQGVLRLARAIHPDLIVAYATRSAPLVALVSRCTGVPCVWHARDYPRWSFPTRLLARACSCVIVPSQQLRASLASRIGREDRGKLRVLPSPIDPALYRRPAQGVSRQLLRSSLGLPGDALVLLQVAQHVPWKGHLDLLEALPAVLERFPSCHLVMLGAAWTPADHACTRQIERRARELGLRERISMHAPSPHVERYYWAADVLVLPSHREPFGRVAIEAFAAGLVPLVSRDSGSATGVAQVSRRLVFEPDDRGALAAAIVDILSSDAETRSGWIDAGCRILDRTYRAAVVVPQIERVYLETASRPK